MIKLDFNDLFAAVDAFDEQAIAKILNTITLEEQRDLQAMLRFLQSVNGGVFRARQLYQPKNEISDRFEPR